MLKICAIITTVGAGISGLLADWQVGMLFEVCGPILRAGGMTNLDSVISPPTTIGFTKELGLSLAFAKLFSLSAFVLGSLSFIFVLALRRPMYKAPLPASHPNDTRDPTA